MEFSIIQHIKRENVIPPLKLKQRVVPEKWYLDPPPKNLFSCGYGSSLSGTQTHGEMVIQTTQGSSFASLPLGWWIFPPHSWPKLPWHLKSVGKFNTWKLLWTWISNKFVPRKEYITPTTVLSLGDYVCFKSGVCICCSVSTIIKLQTIQRGSWSHLVPSSAKWPKVFMKKRTLKRLQFW